MSWVGDVPVTTPSRTLYACERPTSRPNSLEARPRAVAGGEVSARTRAVSPIHDRPRRAAPIRRGAPGWYA